MRRRPTRPGFRTPNIDRIANEGMMFTDYYAEQSCMAGRASFITGQAGLRTGLTKGGLPGRSALACKRKTRQLPRCLNRSVIPPDNLPGRRLHRASQPRHSLLAVDL